MDIIADEKLKVESKEIVYAAVLKWGKHDLPSREEEMCEVICDFFEKPSTMTKIGLYIIGSLFCCCS